MDWRTATCSRTISLPRPDFVSGSDRPRSPDVEIRTREAAPSERPFHFKTRTTRRLWYASSQTQSQAGLPRPLRVHSPEREAQEVELPFRDLTDACLLLVHRQLQLSHDLAQVMHRRFGVASPAQDHEIVGVGDEPRAKALLKTELLPPPHPPAHVKLRQHSTHRC